ncbi:EI24 domain-containing protein [Sphingorhabdus sp. EL138]|uniref:EI24 domain-containing protein n=1 Tax=Sphingorhabdus sp. EL138 TaxID=2073156 RepID=UPI0025FFE6D0|nr:EI24 domain-containing protein [Sphingorhabdus sp. EL138]
MIQALMLSFQSLSDRRVAVVMVKVIVLTIVTLIVSGIGLWFALQALFGWLSVNDTGFWSGLLSAAILGLSGILLFRAVAVAITWVFADDIIDAVEDRFYPRHAAFGKRPSLGAGVHMAVKSIARVVGYNLLALSVYILLLFTGVGTAIAFLLINALLLGRDMEDMLIARHGAKGAMNKLSRVMLGLFGTAGMMVPLVNLFVPVLATAMAVHLVHSEK